MSYDLFFYKQKQLDLTTENISAFLTSNLKSTSGCDTQWFVEDEETETYFSVDFYAPTENDEVEDINDFEYTHFTFNLNYMRPDFFGQEAFNFVDKMIEDLNLFVVNPQANNDTSSIPIKPEKFSLYKNWAELNESYSLHFFDEYGLMYLPMEISNYIYSYRKSRAQLWNELGDDYYVSKLYTYVTKGDNRIITIALLPLETAVVIPKADFYEVSKKYRNFFKTVEENGLVSYECAMNSFGHFLEDYKFPESKILRLDKVNQAQKVYNNTPFEHSLKDYAERAEIEKIVNYKPIE